MTAAEMQAFIPLLSFASADSFIRRYRAAGRKKHLPLNSYVSLYGNEDGEKKGKEQEELLEEISDSARLNPEELFLDRERTEYLENAIEKELSPFEKQVLDLYLTGMSYSEIARVLGREEKSTDNALQRLKGKIRKVL